jgi:polysaccharide biosynthesis transport protein
VFALTEDLTHTRTQNQDHQNQAAGLGPAGIYDILLRHKWKLMGLCFAGLVVAAWVYWFQQPATYSSEAKLFIRYVLESRLPNPRGGDPQIKTPDPGGANILNSEIEIMKSLDLALQVADAIGPAKILGKGAGETNRYVAAEILESGLTVEVRPQSDIVRLVFRHPNREIVQPVLNQFIDAYLRRHVEVHRGVGALDDLLTQQTDELRTRLAQTEAELRKAKTNAGVIAIVGAQKTYTQEIARIRRVLFTTQAELAARRAALQERQKRMPAPAKTPTNQPPVPDWTDETAQIAALQARSEVLNTQMEKLSTDAKTLDEREPIIAELQRKKELEETRYRRFAAMLEQARFDEALSAGKVSNICVVQTPTPPHGECRKLLKTLGMIVGL